MMKNMRTERVLRTPSCLVLQQECSTCIRQFGAKHSFRFLENFFFGGKGEYASGAIRCISVKNHPYSKRINIQYFESGQTPLVTGADVYEDS